VPIYQPGSFTEFIELVVPELQRRGRMRTGYDGSTLRENLFSTGHPRLLPDHPVYRIAGVNPARPNPGGDRLAAAQPDLAPVVIVAARTE